MKHLTTYKVFEGKVNYETPESVEVESTIKDILLELNDESFDAECILWKVDGDRLSFEITIGKSSETPDGHGGIGSHPRGVFEWSDIRDVMDRLCNYIFITSSKAKFDFESDKYTYPGYTSIEYNNPKDLLLDMMNKFPEYYNKYEGWFRLGFVTELKN